MKNIVAVDVGFGRVKALSEQRQLVLPSVVGPWRETGLQMKWQAVPSWSSLPWRVP